ncbi:hypothetical protein [Actinacidiphila acidipaludis]|uniref:Minor tail protein n=1 Tax=Actinacidiphila acidipaludis TaxID=2873382 RepID=A0ABS7Q4K1_9ACTN|nr:hypothetical protein [Streptomyces acidipaludis]MBY8878075.1 hypothetical protein [Streptomyces acidipaludis]
MSATVRSSWLLDSGQTREDTRLTQLGATLPADPVKVQSGILPGSTDGGASRVGAFWLKNQTAMGATVLPGRAVIQGLATQGAYAVTLAEPVVLTFQDGEQQDRIDLVCLQVLDSSYDSSVQTSVSLQIIKGQSGATPQPPALPALALPLYHVRVPAGASAGNTGILWASAVEDLRVTTVSTGGVLPVYGNTAVPGAYYGQLRDRGDLLERWENGAWVAYSHALGGIIPTGSGIAPTYVGQYRDSSGKLQRWNGTAWDTVLPVTLAFVNSADAGSVSSTTYGTVLGDRPAGAFTASFTAPPTGAVLVTLGAAIHTTGDNATTGYMTAQVTQGSTVIAAASDDRAALGTGAYSTSAVTTFRVGGLTPGAASQATAYFRSTDATKSTWFDNLFIRIEPAV